MHHEWIQLIPALLMEIVLKYCWWYTKDTKHILVTMNIFGPICIPLLYLTASIHQLLQLWLHSYLKGRRGEGGGHRRIFHQMSLIQKRCNQQTGPLQPHIVYTYPWCHPSFTWHENMEGEMVQSLAAKVEAPFLAKCDMILATFTPSSQTLPYSPK